MEERYPTAPQMVDIPVETLFEVKCDTRELETNISLLGETVEFAQMCHVTPHNKCATLRHIPPLQWRI